MDESYDYIIVGSGPGGSPVASRLSENPNISVAILEAGDENTNDLSRIPGAFAKVWGTDYDWGYQSTPQSELLNRIISHPRGHVIGGSSAINGGFWLRGSKGDYNSWGYSGASGWNFSEARRVFTEKIENTDRVSQEYRGSNGVMRIEDLPTPTVLTDKMEQAFHEAGLGPVSDSNGEKSCTVCRLETIFKNHSRLTVADNYLSDKVRSRSNLSVIPNTLVTRVIFEGTRATAVEIEREGTISQISARKEIILSAGAFNTPKILKLSGVGPKKELEKLGIPVVSDVPGVGENLSDHLMSPLAAFSPEGVQVSVPMDSSNAAIEQWRKDKSGPAIYWSTNTIGFFSFDSSEDQDIELMMDYNAATNLSDPAAQKESTSTFLSGYTLNIVLMQPLSRGRVTLASADPHDKPIIDPAYLSDGRDIEQFIKAFRRTYELTKAPILAPYTDHLSPEEEASDSQLEEHIRNTASTVFHPAGTAKMGSLDDPTAVVDSSLRVRGVSNLRISDASVLPIVNRGHTMAPSIFVSEKLAEIILQD